MQGKGIIKTFLVLIGLVCLLQVFYLLPTRKVEKNAVEVANAASANAPEAQKGDVYRLAKSRYLD